MPPNFPIFCHGVSLLLKQLATPTITFHQCVSIVSSLPSYFTSAEAADHPLQHVFPLLNEMAFTSTVFLQCWTSWHSPPTRFPSAETTGHPCHHVPRCWNSRPPLPPFPQCWSNWPPFTPCFTIAKAVDHPCHRLPSVEATGLPLHRVSPLLRQSTIPATVSPVLKQLAFLYTVFHHC